MNTPYTKEQFLSLREKMDAITVDEEVMAEVNVDEGTEMGTIGNVDIKQFGMAEGEVGIQLTSKDGYVQLSREEASQLAARLARWAGAKDIARPGQYDAPDIQF